MTQNYGCNYISSAVLNYEIRKKKQRSNHQTMIDVNYIIHANAAVARRYRWIQQQQKNTSITKK